MGWHRARRKKRRGHKGARTAEEVYRQMRKKDALTIKTTLDKSKYDRKDKTWEDYP